MKKICKCICVMLTTIILIGACNVNYIAARAESGISNETELNKARESVFNKYINSISSRKSELQKGKITIGNYTMTFYAEIIGKPDSDGYPIYFGLHGGGNTDTKIQKEQYELMQNYYNYSISSGIYIVPLSLEARYDEHYLPESFLFYDRLIEDAVMFNNGNPNRVYMLGFSSGGDGVYAISPLYADKLAAANMSAGYPHVHKLENMYNLPICLQVGENDDAYDRNVLVAQFDSWLDELNKKYGGGYLHDVYIHKDGTHNSWSDVINKNQSVVDRKSITDWLKNKKNINYVKTNTDAVRWVNKYKRNPIPNKVVWATNVADGIRESKAFYWLDRDGYLDYSTIVASYSKSSNSVNIEKCDASKGTLKIYLNSDMVNLFKDVSVTVAGKKFVVTPVISTQIMEETLKARGDINYMFDAEIDITMSDDVNKIKVEAVSKHKNDYEVKGAENLVRLNKDDLFLVDGSLFGLTYDQLVKKMGVSLPKPEAWPHWGENLQWTSYNIDSSHSVMFMFQDKKIALIYSETEGNIKNSVKKSAEEVFGARLMRNGLPTTEAEYGILTMNTCSRYYFENNEYDGKNHMVQKYVYYKYR